LSSGGRAGLLFGAASRFLLGPSLLPAYGHLSQPRNELVVGPGGPESLRHTLVGPEGEAKIVASDQLENGL